LQFRSRGRQTTTAERSKREDPIDETGMVSLIGLTDEESDEEAVTGKALYELRKRRSFQLLVYRRKCLRFMRWRRGQKARG
jgi:hypothetical protein